MSKHVAVPARAPVPTTIDGSDMPTVTHSSRLIIGAGEHMRLQGGLTLVLDDGASIGENATLEIGPGCTVRTSAAITVAGSRGAIRGYAGRVSPSSLTAANVIWTGPAGASASSQSAIVEVRGAGGVTVEGPCIEGLSIYGAGVAHVTGLRFDGSDCAFGTFRDLVITGVEVGIHLVTAVDQCRFDRFTILGQNVPVPELDVGLLIDGSPSHPILFDFFENFVIGQYRTYGIRVRNGGSPIAADLTFRNGNIEAQGSLNAVCAIALEAGNGPYVLESLHIEGNGWDGNQAGIILGSATSVILDVNILHCQISQCLAAIRGYAWRGLLVQGCEVNGAACFNNVGTGPVRSGGRWLNNHVIPGTTVEFDGTTGFDIIVRERLGVDDLANPELDLLHCDLRMRAYATASLPAASAAMDRTVLVEDAGGGAYNLVLYYGGTRRRIATGATF